MKNIEKFEEMLDEYRIYCIEDYNGVGIADYLKKEEIKKELLRMYEVE